MPATSSGVDENRVRGSATDHRAARERIVAGDDSCRMLAIRLPGSRRPVMVPCRRSSAGCRRCDRGHEQPEHRQEKSKRARHPHDHAGDRLVLERRDVPQPRDGLVGPVDHAVGEREDCGQRAGSGARRARDTGSSPIAARTTWLAAARTRTARKAIRWRRSRRAGRGARSQSADSDRRAQGDATPRTQWRTQPSSLAGPRERESAGGAGSTPGRSPRSGGWASAARAASEPAGRPSTGAEARPSSGGDAGSCEPAEAGGRARRAAN